MIDSKVLATLALALILLPAGCKSSSDSAEDAGVGGAAGAAGTAGTAGTAGKAGSAGAAGDAGVDGDAAPEACTVLPDHFDTDTELPKGCYLAQVTPVIAAAVKLTLDPGVKIIFSKDIGLDFSGDQKLVAVGTAVNPILLTGAQTVRGFWKGLTFSTTSSPDNKLDYVTVEYAGSTTASNDPDAAAIKTVSDSTPVLVSVSHTNLRESGGWGIWLVASVDMAAFANNTLTKNTLGPVSLDSDVVGLLDAESTYKGNDVDQVHVRANLVSKAATWAAIDVPFYLDASLHVDAEWTVSPGNTLIMAKDTELNVNGNTGALIADATAAKPILITGEQKTRGFWGAIAFTNAANPKNTMTYVTVEYAGSAKGVGETADVTLGGTGSPVALKMSHCTLQESNGYGLSVAVHTTLPSFDANTFTKNTKGPVDIDSEVTQLLLPNSAYKGNDVDQIMVHPNLISADVTWQDLGVPYFIDGSMSVDKIWTIDPGVTLILAKDTGFHVPGDAAAVHAVGTSAKPILITGAQKTNGYWRGFVIDNSNSVSNDFEYVTVEYGGGSVGEANDLGELVLTADSHGAKAKVVNSTFQHSAGWAIYLGTNANANADIDTANTFSDNALGNVFHAP